MQAGPDLKPWSSLPVRYTGFEPTDRVRELLDLVVVAKLGVNICRQILELGPEQAVAQLSASLSSMYVDISQNPSRRPYTNDDEISKRLTTSSRIYSFARQGLALPLELLYWQGHSRSVRLPHDMPQNRIRDLAGEGICLPVLGSIITGLRMADAIPRVIRPERDSGS